MIDNNKKILGYTALGFGIVLTAIGLIVLINRSSSDKVKSSGRFLFVGDSLTDDNQSYADQLKKLYPDLNYKKIAKVGEKTDWMKEQLQKELSSGNKYDAITIWGGVDDAYAGVPINTTKSNLQSMYDMAKKSGAKVVGLTIIPTRTYTSSNTSALNKTDELNNWIRKNKSVSVVDSNKAVDNGSGGTKSEYLRSDTLHLTPAGQKEIMKKYSSTIIK